MLPDRVSNPGPLTYESGALPIALRGRAEKTSISWLKLMLEGIWVHFHVFFFTISTKGNNLCEFLSRFFHLRVDPIEKGGKSRHDKVASLEIFLIFPY